MPLENRIPELTQEHRDLLMLLRAAIRDEAPLSPPENWQKVLAIARLHQVDMFLYPFVAKAMQDKPRAASRPPADLLCGWRSAYIAAAA